ncbi:MAG: hypothetical protein KGJ10_08535 [Acidobacteriota bacterium]|nr:hypothetical protein [Acidobacteriota bacterium]
MRLSRQARRVAATLAGVVLLAPSLAASATPPGDLPQTAARPGFGPSFTHEMAQLARAIATDNLNAAEPLFFPEAAYVRLKTGLIAYPASDYQGRLVAFYRLDLAAYHQALYAGARTHYVTARANPADATWITPGACENRFGYWHVGGVRLLFRRNQTLVSVAVDSLISWRGVWYVVHLGPNPRPRDVGTVDDFEKGPGQPGPAGGC